MSAGKVGQRHADHPLDGTVANAPDVHANEVVRVRIIAGCLRDSQCTGDADRVT